MPYPKWFIGPLILSLACSRGDKTATGSPASVRGAQDTATALAVSASTQANTNVAQSAAAVQDSQHTTTAVISPQGGTLELRGVGSVTFPPGAFRSPQRVTVSATSSPETQRDFEVRPDGPRVPYEVRINSGNAAPATPCQVALVVPEAFLEALPSSREVAVFAQIFQDGGQDLLDNFQRILPAAFDRSARTVRTELPVIAFTDRRRADRTFEAIVVVVALLD